MHKFLCIRSGNTLVLPPLTLEELKHMRSHEGYREIHDEIQETYAIQDAVKDAHETGQEVLKKRRGRPPRIKG